MSHEPTINLTGAAQRGDRHVALTALILLTALLYFVAVGRGWFPGTAPAHEEPGVEAAHGLPEPPALYAVVPFVLLLGAIAILPLTGKLAHWWEHNLHRFYVAAVLGLVTLAYYALLHEHPVRQHFLRTGLVEPAAGGISLGMAWATIENALLVEYVPFIVVLFALFTITGGIRVVGDVPAHPLTNTGFLALGGFLASFIGTTGAAMVLIRPLLQTNSERSRVVHTVIFFIFVVCNCGGCLLPIGDPPLFLGYLRGVEFTWTLWHLWPQWLMVNLALLAIYYLWDTWFAYPRETLGNIARDERVLVPFRAQGLALNACLLVGVVLAAALLSPGKPLPGTSWEPWLYLREVVMLLLIAASLALGPREARAGNEFSFAPIVEVAVLFLGIFLCMQPALQILDARGAQLGVDSPQKFFWASGTLSSVLDNAPTYLVFFETARSLTIDGAKMAGVEMGLLSAISLGSVFMGAMTYIGNGPNFMVKSIAEAAGVKMPTFFGYLVYSLVVLLPVLVVVSLISDRFLW
ncbi:MAG: sodium:proton antiporter [Pirellulales bacterium]|nr:sodium:proton antiporter [Pirellulales bacterium]